MSPRRRPAVVDSLKKIFLDSHQRGANIFKTIAFIHRTTPTKKSYYNTVDRSVITYSDCWRGYFVKRELTKMKFAQFGVLLDYKSPHRKQFAASLKIRLYDVPIYILFPDGGSSSYNLFSLHRFYCVHVYLKRNDRCKTNIRIIHYTISYRPNSAYFR